jgi:hypothetical protein
LRDPPTIGSYAVGEIPLCFYIPMERFFDGMDQENSKNKEGKNGGKKKKSYFFFFFQFFLRMWRFPYWCVLSGTPSGYCPCATLLRRTHSYGNLPYNIIHINVVPSA